MTGAPAPVDDGQLRDLGVRSLVQAQAEAQPQPR